jgi:hypothetical protein
MESVYTLRFTSLRHTDFNSIYDRFVAAKIKLRYIS